MIFRFVDFVSGVVGTITSSSPDMPLVVVVAVVVVVAGGASDGERDRAPAFGDCQLYT